MTCYGYVRVSTDKQSVENQRFEIKKFAKENNFTIDKWVLETISSTKDLEKRKLNNILKKIKKDDIIISSELSRLGRNLLQVMGILHHCMNKECQVWTIKENYRLGADIQSKVLAFAFSLSSEIEKSLISQRTKATFDRMKAEGKILGRPKGSKNKKMVLDDKKDAIINLLESGFNKSEIARILKVDRSTLYYFLKTNV